MLECSWDELLNKMNDAEDLDCVIAAHQVFLDTISTRCLLDKQSQVSWPPMGTSLLLVMCDSFRANLLATSAMALVDGMHGKDRLEL